MNIQKYVVEFRMGERDGQVSTRGSYSEAITLAKQKIREGATHIVVLGFNNREECVLENKIT